jgi:hypothetical protein
VVMRNPNGCASSVSDSSSAAANTIRACIIKRAVLVRRPTPPTQPCSSADSTILAACGVGATQLDS